MSTEVRLKLAPTARPPEEAARAASHCCPILTTLKELPVLGTLKMIKDFPLIGAIRQTCSRVMCSS